MANGNATFRHSNVALLGLTEILAPNEVTSQEFDDRLADTLSMLNLPTGLLQRVAGVYARRNWDQPNQFADGAIAAGKKALAEAGVSPDSIGLMVNTSVTREHL
ncbi:MAG: 3-oxoacyl-ACP synthase III, partial [Brevibacterium aurantiacum]